MLFCQGLYANLTADDSKTFWQTTDDPHPPHPRHHPQHWRRPSVDPISHHPINTVNKLDPLCWFRPISNPCQSTDDLSNRRYTKKKLVSQLNIWSEGGDENDLVSTDTTSSREAQTRLKSKEARRFEPQPTWCFWLLQSAAGCVASPAQPADGMSEWGFFSRVQTGQSWQRWRSPVSQRSVIAAGVRNASAVSIYCHSEGWSRSLQTPV